VCDVAHLVKRHGPALRRVRDVEPSEVKSAVERLAESAARIIELEVTVGEALAETSRHQDAKEKAAFRNKEKTNIKTAAISKLRAFYKDKMIDLKVTAKKLFAARYDAKADHLEAVFDEALAAETKKIAAKLAAEVEKLAAEVEKAAVAGKRARDAEVKKLAAEVEKAAVAGERAREAEVEKLAAEVEKTAAACKKTAVARKRARDIEAAARRGSKYLKRARKAEREVKALETIEEEEVTL
jgi:colicin import membrane protein